MSMKWCDVSMPLRTGMTVWPGDPPFRFEPKGRITQGASCNTSVITLATHTGTHCDAPWHFEETGGRLHEVDSSVFFGDALLVEIPEVDVITADHLQAEPYPERVLFKTKNAAYPPNAPFQNDFCALDVSAARRLVADGVRLVGIDYLSVAPRGQSGPTHHVLLQHEVFVVEGLLLHEVPPGVHPFVVLPLPLHEADGAPCRAFVGLQA